MNIKLLFAGIGVFGLGLFVGRLSKNNKVYNTDNIIGKIIVNPDDSDMAILLNNDPSDIKDGIYSIEIEKTKYIRKAIAEDDIVN